jgi:hypothetical protein
MGSDFQEGARGRVRDVLPYQPARRLRPVGCPSDGMEVDAVIREIYTYLPIAMTNYLRPEENFDKSAPMLFNVRYHGSVAKKQRRRPDPKFLMMALGGLASLPVSIIIRPVRRQNVVPTHWVRK